MSDIASPSAVFDQATKFFRVMEKAGLTREYIQRVIDRPSLRQEIVACIKADADYEAAVNEITISVELSDDVLKSIIKDDSSSDAIIAGINRTVELVDGLTIEKLIQAIALNKNQPLLFERRYGLLGDEPMSVSQLARFYGVSSHTINNKIKRVQSSLRLFGSSLKSDDDWFLWLAFQHKLISRQEYEQSSPLPEVDLNSIDALKLTVRTYSCLRREGINTIDKLVAKKPSELLEIRNFRQSVLDELVSKLAERGLSLASE